MASILGEKIPFEKPVFCVGGVEHWLNALLAAVKENMRNVIAAQCQALADPEYVFVKGFVNFPGQVNKILLLIRLTNTSIYMFVYFRLV